MSYKRIFSILIIIFFLALFLNLTLGSVLIPFKEFMGTLINGNKRSPYYQIIYEYRLYKSISVVLSGIALGLSGLFMQTLFKNPIVGPYILGLSSGAGLLVAGFIFGAGFIDLQLNGLSISFIAAIGSLLTLLLILSIYYKLRSTYSLLITGLMIGIFSGAIVSVLSYFTKADNLQKYIFWSMGNTGNLSINDIIIFSIIVIVFASISLLLSKSLNALLLGDNYAVSLGISLKKTHYYILIITGILTGTVTAMVGPIAFIGLIVPHITGMIFKTNMHQILIPGVVLTGSILMLIFDTVSQVPGSIYTLPINSITAIFGAPLVIFMLFRTNLKK